MTVSRSVAEILDEHTTLEVECIDRIYLNLYVPILQREAGIAHFWRSHRGSRFPSGAQMGPMSRAFVRSIERFADQEGVPLIRFERGQRKDEVAQRCLEDFHAEEGVVFIGKGPGEDTRRPSDAQIAQHVGKAVQGPGDCRVIRLELQRHLRHSARERARALQDLVDLSHRLSEGFTELWIHGLGRFERRLKLVESFPKALSLVGE